MVAKDNTISHQGLLLQLLGDNYRGSYAGYRVELRRYPDNRIEVVSGDHLINFTELPQKPRYFSAKLEFEKSGIPMPAWLQDILKGAENRSRRPSNNAKSRRPTPRQRALWEAVQAAKRKGLPILRIAKELGITRETVRRYGSATTPPLYKDRLRKKKGTKTKLLTKSLDN